MSVSSRTPNSDCPSIEIQRTRHIWVHFLHASLKSIRVHVYSPTHPELWANATRGVLCCNTFDDNLRGFSYLRGSRSKEGCLLRLSRTSYKKLPVFGPTARMTCCEQAIRILKTRYVSARNQLLVEILQPKFLDLYPQLPCYANVNITKGSILRFKIKQLYGLIVDPDDHLSIVDDRDFINTTDTSGFIKTPAMATVHKHSK